MKIIISENQEMDVEKKFIFMLLNNMNYNLIEIGDTIYFIKNINDTYVDIKLDTFYDWCDISNQLLSFLVSVTGLNRTNILNLTSQWVRQTLEVRIRHYVWSGNIKNPTVK
jgi:hypothetical protein